MRLVPVIVLPSPTWESDVLNHRDRGGIAHPRASFVAQRVNLPSGALAVLDDRVIRPYPADAQHRNRRWELRSLDQLHRPDPTHPKNLRQLRQRHNRRRERHPRTLTTYTVDKFYS